MISFSVFNIPVRVLPWFWITMVLIGNGLRADSRQAILELLLFVIAGFISILVHELGHALTARRFGNQVHIVLQAFGGYAAYSGATQTRPRSIMITAAGPAIQIVLGVIALVLLKTIPGLNHNSSYFLFVLGAISLVWAVLNLLPVLPLDGGRLVESALGPARQKLTLWISGLTGAAVAALAFLYYGQPFIAIFMAMFAYQSFKALREPSWK